MSDIFGELPGFEHSESSTEAMLVIAAQLGIGIEEIRPLSEAIGATVLSMMAKASKESTLAPSNPRVEIVVRPDNLSTSPALQETAQTLESLRVATGAGGARD